MRTASQHTAQHNERAQLTPYRFAAEAFRLVCQDAFKYLVNPGRCSAMRLRLCAFFVLR